MGMTDKDILLSDLNDISEILNNNGYGGWCVAIRKAVELLKEQDALAVREDKVNKCVCGNEINRYWHPEYCGFCGKKLEWY